MEKLLKNKKEIIAWLNQHKVEKYTLIKDIEYGFLVDVDGDVFLNGTNLLSIPINFNIVSKGFYCSNNQLTSLEGCPKEVGLSFDCSFNNLRSLHFSPKSIGKIFYCHDNDLLSLEGAPISVGEIFDCSNNKLTSLEHFPNSLGGYFYCNGNALPIRYHGVKSFAKLKEIMLSDREKELLSVSLHLPAKTNLHKV